ncbi:CFAP61 isoform 10 [Pan troglodytes]|uniref:CFAP61 isoform 10 n=1 Tax=Pan troglodytes TaxID=9598 RepID=A0A2J8KWW8_PANTR|nr:CFAP61 isoform 10 [Pan troglodytes]
MSVCSRVNMQLLHECFDLGPFHGLCFPHPDDVLESPQDLSVRRSQDPPRRGVLFLQPSVPWSPPLPRRLGDKVSFCCPGWGTVVQGSLQP